MNASESYYDKHEMIDSQPSIVPFYYNNENDPQSGIEIVQRIQRRYSNSTDNIKYSNHYHTIYQNSYLQQQYQHSRNSHKQTISGVDLNLFSSSNTMNRDNNEHKGGFPFPGYQYGNSVVPDFSQNINKIQNRGSDASSAIGSDLSGRSYDTKMNKSKKGSFGIRSSLSPLRRKKKNSPQQTATVSPTFSLDTLTTGRNSSPSIASQKSWDSHKSATSSTFSFSKIMSKVSPTKKKNKKKYVGEGENDEARDYHLLSNDSSSVASFDMSMVYNNYSTYDSLKKNSNYHYNRGNIDPYEVRNTRNTKLVKFNYRTPSPTPLTYSPAISVASEISDNDDLMHHDKAEPILEPPPLHPCVVGNNNNSSPRIKNSSSSAKSTRSKSRSRGGPVDLDTDEFYDVEAHLKNIHLMAATHLKNCEYEDALEVFTHLLNSQITHYKGRSNKYVASTWHNIGIVYSKSFRSSNNTSIGSSAAKPPISPSFCKKIPVVTPSSSSTSKKSTSPQNADSKNKWMGCIQLAIDAFQNSIGIYEELYGKDHPIIATSLIKKGFLQLSNKSTLEEALITFQQALRIRLIAYGKKHPLVAKTHNNLGVAYLHLNKIDLAKEEFKLAVDIQRYILADLYNNKGEQDSKKNEDNILQDSLSLTSNKKNTDKNSDTDDIAKRVREIKLEVANIQANLGCMLLDVAVGKRKAKSRIVQHKTSSNLKDDKNKTSDEKAYSLPLSPSFDQSQTSSSSTSTVSKSTTQDRIEAESALSEAMSIRISILGENHPLIEPTRKKFELARALVRKDIEKKQRFLKILQNKKVKKKTVIVAPTTPEKDGSHSNTTTSSNFPLKETPQVKNKKKSATFITSDIFKSNKGTKWAIHATRSGSVTNNSNSSPEIEGDEVMQFADLPLPSSSNSISTDAITFISNYDFNEYNRKRFFVVHLLEDNASNSYDERTDEDEDEEEISRESERAGDTAAAQGSNGGHWLQDPDMTIEKLQDTAKSLFKDKKYRECLAAYTTILNSQQEVNNDDKDDKKHCRSIGHTHHEMGILYLCTREIEKALESFQKAYNIRTEMGEDHPDTLKTQMKLGISQIQLGKFRDALANFENVVKLRKSTLGYSNPLVAYAYNNLGCAHVELQEFKEAHKAFETSVEIQHAALVNEPENRDLTLSTATVLSNLGYLYSFKGILDKAGVVFREALMLQESALGSHHSVVLATIDSLADICIRNNNYAGSLRWYNYLLSRMQEYRSQSLRRHSLRQILILYKLSRVHLKQNDDDTALEKVKSALELIQRLGDKGVKGDKLENMLSKELERLENKIETSEKLEWI